VKLLEWGPNDTTTYEVTAAELRELVLECSVAYGNALFTGHDGSFSRSQGPKGAVQVAEWARNRVFGSMIRKLTCAP
jgi:hypothetical protein